MSQEFLVELGTEELPPTALKKLSIAFTQGIENGLKAHKLNFAAITPYATPRRLAVLVEGLAESTPIENIKVFGPPVKIAFDAKGNPTKAAEAFAKKNNTTIDKLSQENDGKLDKLAFSTTSGGEKAATLLESIVTESLAKLPINKRMRWGANRTEFVRPVHWLLMLLDDTVLDANILGLSASNQTFGHRFHYNKAIAISMPKDYAETLQSTGHVIVDFAERQKIIVEQVNAAAKKIGGTAVISDDLLDEVTGLVEFPVALAGKFDESFLSVPTEALISSMKEHQKYFHVIDKSGKLLPSFITVSNIVSQDPAQIIDGNERVIRPRLADAVFFFETDKKTTLTALREKLKTVVFQAKLGTVYEKTERIEKLSVFIAKQLKSNSEHAARAAQLCKSDLVSNMVGEFASMQGIAGYHYALNDNEPEEIALAIGAQYKPKFSGDSLPATTTGAIIALADRLDTVVGIFGIGQKPTGSKDPFALRRASLGALRLLVEKEFDLDLRDLITIAANGFPNLPAKDTVVDDVLNYMIERFKAWYEEENIASEVFQAVSAKALSHPLDINNRVHAVAAFTKLPESQALAAANKRVSNILAKCKTPPAAVVDPVLLTESAEQNLAQELERLTAKVKPLLAVANYTDAMLALAALQKPVDTFFDDVMVMTDNMSVRNNRLALLQKLRELFLDVADISLLVPAKG